MPIDDALINTTLPEYAEVAIDSNQDVITSSVEIDSDYASDEDTAPTPKPIRISATLKGKGSDKRGIGTLWRKQKQRASNPGIHVSPTLTSDIKDDAKPLDGNKLVNKSGKGYLIRPVDRYDVYAGFPTRFPQIPALTESTMSYTQYADQIASLNDLLYDGKLQEARLAIELNPLFTRYGASVRLCPVSDAKSSNNKVVEIEDLEDGEDEEVSFDVNHYLDHSLANLTRINSNSTSTSSSTNELAVPASLFSRRSSKTSISSLESSFSLAALSISLGRRGSATSTQPHAGGNGGIFKSFGFGKILKREDAKKAKRQRELQRADLLDVAAGHTTWCLLFL